MLGQKRQLKIMRAALLYYANRDTYRRVGVHPKGSPVKYDPAPIVVDHGSRARLALRETEGSSPFRLFRRKPVHLGELHLSGKSNAIHAPDPVADRLAEDLL